MKSRCKLNIFFLCLLGFNFLFAQTENAAVLNLEIYGISRFESMVLVDAFRLELYNTGKFTLMERGRMESILEDKGFQTTGCSSDECLMEAGRILNLPYIIGGSLGKVGPVFSVNIRLIDVKTGSIVQSAVFEKESDIDALSTTGMQEIAAQLASSSSTEPRKIPVTKPAVSTTGSLNITSNKAGAEIYINGQPLRLKGEICRTPYRIEKVRPGRIKIGLKWNNQYKENYFTIAVGSEATARFEFKDETPPAKPVAQEPARTQSGMMDAQRPPPEQFSDYPFYNNDLFLYVPYNPARLCLQKRPLLHSEYIWHSYNEVYTSERTNPDGTLVFTRLLENDKASRFLSGLLSIPLGKLSLGFRFTQTDYIREGTKNVLVAPVGSEEIEQPTTDSEHSKQHYSFVAGLQIIDQLALGAGFNILNDEKKFMENDTDFEYRKENFNVSGLDIGLLFNYKNRTMFGLTFQGLGGDTEFDPEDESLDETGGREKFYLELPLTMRLEFTNVLSKNALWLSAGYQTDIEEYKILSEHYEADDIMSFETEIRNQRKVYYFSTDIQTSKNLLLRAAYTHVEEKSNYDSRFISGISYRYEGALRKNSILSFGVGLKTENLVLDYDIHITTYNYNAADAYVEYQYPNSNWLIDPSYEIHNDYIQHVIRATIIF